MASEKSMAAQIRITTLREFLWLGLVHTYEMLDLEGIGKKI